MDGLELTHLGRAFAGHFDFDGDGVEDLAVGAPGGGVDWNAPGRVYVLRGPLVGPLALEDALVLVGNSAVDHFGDAVIGIPDQDGDGRDELLVGAPDDDEGGFQAGSVTLIYGFWPE